MGVAMMIIALVIGRIQITAAQHTQLLLSMQVAFLLFAVLCVSGIYFSFVRYSEPDHPDTSVR
jgi:hypothetical protein